MKRLYLHTHVNDDEESYLELQKEKQKYGKLLEEIQPMRETKRKLEHDLLKQHNDFHNLM
jgi:hypothetical protein